MSLAFEVTFAANEADKVSSYIPIVDRLEMLVIHPDDVLRRIYTLRPLGRDHADHVARRRLEALGSLGHLGYLCRLRIYRVHRSQHGGPPIERIEFLRVSHSAVFTDDLRREFGPGEYKLAVYAPTGAPYLDKPEYLAIDTLGIAGGLPLELAAVVRVDPEGATLTDANPQRLASLLGVT